VVSAGNRLHAQKAHDGVPAGEKHVFDDTLGKRGQMEIYFPENHDPSKPVPGVILFHGGGWTSGDLVDFRYHCHYLASRGLVAATSNYELRTKKDDGTMTGKEVCVRSAKSAIRYFKQNAGKLGIDPDQIITGGGSAGAHVSLMATLHPGHNDPRDPAGIDTSVVAYLLYNPAVDLRDPILQEVLAKRDDLSDLPPSVAFFGTSDTYLQGYLPFAEAFRKKSAPRMDLWLAEWETHVFFKKRPWLELCTIQTDRFLAELGFLQGEPTLAIPDGGAHLTQTPDLSLPDEILQRVVFSKGKFFHLGDCKQRPDAATETTVAKALEEGFANCQSCKPHK
jgi:acetyl esterase/lipase